MLEADIKKEGRVTASDLLRPPLLGFDQTAAGFHMLTNQLISLRMENGNHKLKHLDGPIWPMEVVDARLRAFSKGKRDSAIEKAQSKPKWRKQQPEVIDA